MALLTLVGVAQPKAQRQCAVHAVYPATGRKGVPLSSSCYSYGSPATRGSADGAQRLVAAVGLFP